MNSLREMTLPEQIAHVEQMLLVLEDQASVSIARIEKDERVGRRGRYFSRDCMSRVFLACWGVLGYCKRQAAVQEGPMEPAKEAIEGLLQTMMELSIVTQLLPVMVDLLLDGEGPAPRRVEGWPRVKDFRQVEEGAAAPPAKPEGPG